MRFIKSGTDVLVLAVFFAYTMSKETHSNINDDDLLDAINLLETKFSEFKKDDIAKELEQTTKIMVQETLLSLHDTKIANLLQTIAEAAAKISLQEERIAEQDRTIANLRAGVDLSTSQIDTLKTQKVCGCVGQCSVNNEITNKLNLLSDRVSDIDDGEECKNWTNEVIQRQSDAGNTAFFVRMSGTLIWDDVVTNLGNGYNNETGIFTVPESGVYVFQWMLLAYHRTSAYTELVVNNARKIRNHAESVGVNLAMSNTASAILTLDKGDLVLIRKYNGNLKIYGQMWSAFQGFRL